MVRYPFSSQIIIGLPKHTQVPVPVVALVVQAACDGDAAHEVDVRELWQPELGVPRCLQ
eukprot:COSAG02_NODE_45704_length_354_cov_1.831373_2_plen_58_part_01